MINKNKLDMKKATAFLKVVILMLTVIACESVYREVDTEIPDDALYVATPRPYEPVTTQGVEPAPVPDQIQEPVPDQTVEPESEPEPEPMIYTARLAIVGDLMVHEPQVNHALNREDRTYCFISSFTLIKPYLYEADYTIGNLETTFAGQGTRNHINPETGWTLFSAPDSFATALKEAGFDLVTTANNHSNDFREFGILRTIEILESIGLEYTGTNASKEDQDSLFIKDINNIRFAFLSYATGLNDVPLTAGKPFLVNRLSDNLMKQQIEQARQEGAEIIIVFPHMGVEFTGTPAERHVTIAHNILKFGADVVMASHPHVLQPTEIVEIEDEDGTIRTCFIAYSMGDFISSRDQWPRDAGAIFYLEFEKVVVEDSSVVRLSHVSFAPTWVQLKNADNETLIRVLPVNDTLMAIDNGSEVSISAEGVTRLLRVHKHVTTKLLGEEPIIMQPIYTLFCKME